MKAITAGIGTLVIVAVLASAAKSHHVQPGPVTSPASNGAPGHIAVSSDDESLHFTVTCDDSGGVVTVKPDTAATRTAATRECHNAAHDYAVLSSVAATGG
jgi:hypothetical protein